MMKGLSSSRLFFKKAANPSDTAAEMENRAPLSPIPVEDRNKVAHHQGHFPATLQGKKLPSSLCQKYPSAENVENITAFPPDSPDQKFSATPKSVTKKRFGWNTRQQSHHEEASTGLFCRKITVNQQEYEEVPQIDKVEKDLGFKMRFLGKGTSHKHHGTASTGNSGLRPTSAMANGSPKQYPRDVALELHNHFLDTSSSSSSTCSDLSIPSCSSSSSIHSGHTASSKMGYDSESAQSTPRTPSKTIPRPGKPGAPNSTAGTLKGPQRGLTNSHPAKGANQHSVEPTFELQEDPDFWNEHNIQVLVRTRPLSSSEAAGQGFTRCLRQDSAQTITWLGQPETRFTFDHVAGESITQEDLFRVAGFPMVENCMRGYNSSMFAYGQTGSGKTHTMLGDIDDLAYRPSNQRGMTPRIFEYLFTRIQQEEQQREHEQLRYVCKCSFLEIYNEHITDLLDPSSTNLQIREDAKSGVYVENLKEIVVTCVQDVIQLLVQGAANRKVAATNMNRESSRSHSVFACSVESKWESNSLTNIRFGRLNLVDLAGSERQKSSGAEGDRLKEAANINKSLSTLGLVIMILVDVANGKQRHVPYRDSKLTFLLQDSLGGNSKTTVIATVSPSSCNALETLSTLKFAQRAKFIRNNAIINEDASGNVIALRREIQQLKEEVSQLKRQSVSSMQRFESDHESPAPGLSSNNLLHKIKAVEATLSGALRREQVSHSAAKRYAAEVEQLQFLVQQRDQNTQSGKMILRFRDEKIHRLEAFVAGKLPADHYLTEENKRLAEELELVQGQIDRNPELTRFAMDNIRLMEQVRGYQQFYDSGERETMMEEISNIRDQLLEMTEAKLALEQGAVAVSSAQADKYRRELEICCNDLSTCLEVNSKLTKQVEELQAQVGQLSARCQEQQQDLDLLKAQPMGRFEELELERAVHLQIIADLKAQLKQRERDELKASISDDDLKNAVQDKHTVQDQTQACCERPKMLESEFATYTEELLAEKGSLFDEDIEQLQVCDVKQTEMETEFETFSELMTEKESLLDEDIDNLEVDTKRQSLESEFEAYAELMAERKAYLNEELVHQQVCAKTLEMASQFEPYTELMEGEELLLSEGLKQLSIDMQMDLASKLEKPSGPNSADMPITNVEHQQVKPTTQPEADPESATVSKLLEEKDSLLDEDMEHLEVSPTRLSLESVFETQCIGDEKITKTTVPNGDQVHSERAPEAGLCTEVILEQSLPVSVVAEPESITDTEISELVLAESPLVISLDEIEKIETQVVIDTGNLEEATADAESLVEVLPESVELAANADAKADNMDVVLRCDLTADSGSLFDVDFDILEVCPKDQAELESQCIGLPVEKEKLVLDEAEPEEVIETAETEIERDLLDISTESELGSEADLALRFEHKSLHGLNLTTHEDALHIFSMKTIDFVPVDRIIGPSQA